jgi:hypothetical protein
MATAGVAIGSAKAAAEAIVVAAAQWPVAAVMRAAAGEQFAPTAVARFAATQRILMLEGRVPAHPIHQRPTPTAAVDRTRRLLIAAVAADIKAAAVVDKVVEVVDMPVVAAADIKAADTSNR